jgi:ubiquitin-conjugating enzyme E2 variant
MGVLMADFASGTVHWIGDRYFREDTPLIGPLLIEPFREHHRDPRGITTHGLIELHGNTGLPVVWMLALVL